MRRYDLQMRITDSQLSGIFGYLGGWVNGMIATHLQHLNSDKPVEHGRPKSVKSHLERGLIQFCLNRQPDKASVTMIEATIEVMAENGTQIDRFWVRHFSSGTPMKREWVAERRGRCHRSLSESGHS
jgi:hypothetical protein